MTLIKLQQGSEFQEGDQHFKNKKRGWGRGMLVMKSSMNQLRSVTNRVDQAEEKTQ